MSIRLAALTLALILLCAQAEAARVIGYVRDTATQRYLYTEVHEQNLAPDGAVQTGVTTYFDAQGREIARKTLDYRSNRTVPIYRMDIPAVRYAEGISSNSPQALVFKRDGDKEERKALPLDDGLVAADAGFNQLLQDQLDTIRKGETVKFGLIVAGHTNRYGFRAKKVDEQRVDGQTVLRVLVEPDSLLRLVVPAIALSYDLKTRRLLSYQGVSNIIDPDTSKVYKLISISYGGVPPADARLPAIAVEAR
ncbi:MAG: hypothetical protein HY019_04065 [Aquabacterium sp.]|uniref:hypothetical protein n=1 Tax=Aquabacterium sp. TaxID=1872578 RepID=UPI0025C09EAC|nr:hypothetical protein [Aquabacterium sp.]MBI3381162.1 hypothetical protein [Aquabacterium sp.]